MGSDAASNDKSERPWPGTTPNQINKATVDGTELQNTWEESMKGVGGVGLPHRSCAVLLINWEAKLDDLHTGTEVDALEAVFVNVYRYTVVKKQLVEGKHNPQHQVLKILIEFVEAHDDENTLLIVYYAGHGLPGQQGQGPEGLVLAG